MSKDNMKIINVPWMGGGFELHDAPQDEKAELKALKHKHPRVPKVKKRALSFIPDNEISELNPYTIMVSTTGPAMNSVTLAVVQTDGSTLPPKIDVRCKALLKIVQKWSNLNVGTTAKCAFHRDLSSIIALRNHMNLCHRVRLKKQLVTEKMMKAVMDPKWKQELIEAACIAAV